MASRQQNETSVANLPTHINHFFYISNLCRVSIVGLKKIYTFMYSTFLKLSFVKQKKNQLFSFPFSMVHFHVLLLSSKIHSGPKTAHSHTLIHGRWPHHMFLGEFEDKRIFLFTAPPGGTKSVLLQASLIISLPPSEDIPARVKSGNVKKIAPFFCPIFSRGFVPIWHPAVGL